MKMKIKKQLIQITNWVLVRTMTKINRKEDQKRNGVTKKNTKKPSILGIVFLAWDQIYMKKKLINKR